MNGKKRESRPCPFCGSDAEIIRSQSYYEPQPVTFHYSAGCLGCGVISSNEDAPDGDIDYAIRRWNTRHEPPILAWAEANPDAVKALLSGEAWICGWDLAVEGADKHSRVNKESKPT